jgi:isochorismate synthase
MIDFFIKVKQQVAQHLPFVIYSKPNKNSLVGLFQKNDHLYFAENFTERGFVFAPFEGSQMVLIPKEQSVKWEAELISFEENKHADVEFLENKEAKEHFEAVVQKGIDAIEKGFFTKVVLSREEIVDVPHFDLVSVFTKLLQAYPTAFTYCWFHPKIGLWIGATPERLLKANENRFSTMALAGTQIYEGVKEVVWGKKEIEEQQFVTDFILENLKNKTSEVTISSPYTLKAGNLLHIKTDIEGVINEQSNLKEVVSILHPTPAVCGLPKDKAKAFIFENEGYDRGYYSGFLGELNRRGIDKQKSKTDLFVNLRCMQMEIDPPVVGKKEAMVITKAHLYMGCGITKDSIPENEWKESVNKSMTMRRVL